VVAACLTLLLTLTKRIIIILLKLDVFSITDLHILLFLLRLWRRWLSIFPGHSVITLMMLLRL